MGAKQCSGYDRAGEKDADGRPIFSGQVSEDVAHFGFMAFITQLILIGFYCMTDYEFASSTVFDASTALNFFLGVATFMVAGMGFAGCWMKAYGISAFGFGLLLISLCLQESILIEGWMTYETMKLKLSIMNFLTASFGVVAVLISWGALAGKISPLTMLWFSGCELAIYYTNKVYILQEEFHVIDNGGCISMFVFGSFFGVSVSLGHSLAPYLQLHEPSYMSEVFSNIGVAFMWLYFPTLMGANNQMNTAEQRTAIMNTIFALLGSTMAAFAMAPIFNPVGPRFEPRSLRLATLSGGVSVSAIANLGIGPGGALIVGTMGGTLSAYLCSLQADARRPLIERLEFHDTYGVMWLFGIPGVFGACCSMAVSFIIPATGIIWTDQLLGLLCTISIASISGFIVGRIAKCSRKLFPYPDLDYNDLSYWNCSEEIPNDVRGN